MLRPDRGRANTEFARKSTSRQPQPANPMSPIRPINSPNQHLGNSSRTTNEAERRSKAAPYIWSARALSIAGLVLGLIAVVNIAEAFGYSVPYLSGSPHIPNA